LSILNSTIYQLADLLDKKEISSVELTKTYLAQADKLQQKIAAYITIMADEALKSAQESDQRRQTAQTLGPLDGIPLALSDNFCTSGTVTTCASKMLENFLPPYNAACWQKLHDQGAVLLGKCNMDEFTVGSSSFFGNTKNPYDTEHPLDGSGGAAAIVAARMAAYTLGVDTDGSLRRPAASCGVVGLKPTYGRISRYGIIPSVSSMDQAGICSSSIADCALLLATLAGQDANDSTSAPVDPLDYTAACQDNLQGLKIGLPTEYFPADLDPLISKKVQEAADKLQEMGAKIIPVSLPHSQYASATGYILTAAEAGSNLSRYHGTCYGLRVEKNNVNDMFAATRAQGFGEGIKMLTLMGIYFLSSGQYEAYYHKALQVRTLIKDDYDQVFNKVDALLTPTTLATANKTPEATNAKEPHEDKFFTVSANLAGLPALTIPYGLLDDRPFGLQLVGSAFDEGKLFTIGQALENIAGRSPLPKLAEEV
jgi:aspartyl-tRNA(Asn)/glutamyl-tRNA(Gln) amidotransferase subunit A